MARGSIRQRSKVRRNSWTVQVYLGVDPATGRKRYRSEAVVGTRAQAQRRLTEILRDLDAGGAPVPSGLTVGEYLADWLRDGSGPRVGSRTLEGYRDHVRLYISPRIGRVALARLTPRQVQDMEAELVRNGGRGGRGLSPRTVSQTHRILHKALEDAVRLGLVSRNVSRLVDPPRFSRHEVRTLAWDEVLRFLGGVDDPLLRTLFLLAVHTGLRRSELLGLQWRDVDLKGGVLSVRRGLVKHASGSRLSEPKSGRGRVVVLTEESAGALSDFRERHSGNGDFVFCRPDGTPLKPASVSQAFRRTVHRVGLEGLRFHDLRHTHASLMLSEGVHLKVVSERLGHSSVAITGDIYSHVQPSVQREAVERFGVAWRSGMAKEWQLRDEAPGNP
jgi:integrase